MRIKMDLLNLAEMKKLAIAFSKVLKPSTIVLLQGDLGSGKTTFVKEVVTALGSSDAVTSPTYTLMNTYQAEFPIYHFDMYRLSSAEEAMGVGFEEYFDKNSLDGVCFVEWAENVEGLIPSVDYVVEISKLSQNGRRVIIKEVANVSN